MTVAGLVGGCRDIAFLDCPGRGFRHDVLGNLELGLGWGAEHDSHSYHLAV